ncbi:MAG: hypothetical protein PHO37_17165 [Kiritimatiellae bacterium]|nr:hypothetical protein [Kiritimatiellia bacterium]
MQKNLTITLLSAALLHTILAEAAEHFEVGHDKPHKTISSALTTMKDGDTCIISAGVYRECVAIQQNNVTLRGQGLVVITGCDEAGEMHSCVINGKHGLMKSIDGPIYDVFHGQHYLMLARFPNKTCSMTSNEDWAFANIDEKGNVMFCEKHLTTPTDLKDGYYVGLHSKGNKLSSWYSLTLPIVGVSDDGSIHVDRKNASSGYMGKYGQGNGLGYVIGAKAALDAPGEWYSDSKQVWVIPPTSGADAYELRTRLYGAVITGNGVRLENIRFKAAAGRVEGNDVSFLKCAFEYISPFQHNPNDHPKNQKDQSMVSCWGAPDNGTAGVFVQGDGFVAEDCRFAKSWWCGMMLRGNRARIENCLFENVNWMAKRCAGLFSWGDDNVVRHCTLRNLGGAGIEGGNAAWVGQYAKRNIWEYNYIEDVCKLIVDQGFFYVNHQKGDSPTAESIWRYNVGKTAQGPKKGNWSRCVAAYYIDNSSSGYHIHNNIAINAINPMKHNDTQDGTKASQDIWYYNNTFYKCGNAAFGCFGDSKKRDADLNLVNNLAVSCSEEALAGKHLVKTHVNNQAVNDESVLVAPQSMDFTPQGKNLMSGAPVLGQTMPYVGAVDPDIGMWRYGADELKLPAQ